MDYYIGFSGEEPYVPSDRKPCTSCGALVWCAKSTYGASTISFGKPLPVVCIECAQKVAAGLRDN